MPLPIASSEDLTIPPRSFNENGLAVIMLSGARYGGDWVISATASAHGPAFGKLWTSVDERRKQALEQDPGYPDRAIETAFIWLAGETKRQDLRVVMFERLNDQYGESERPYFCLARAVIASEKFTPMPGVTYADEMTLDAAMGYVSQP